MEIKSNRYLFKRFDNLFELAVYKSFTEFSYFGIVFDLHSGCNYALIKDWLRY